jgi:hypothetical protein
MDEPSPSPDGWQVKAHGTGTQGNDFMAYYTTWNANSPVNLAIVRGLPWQNPGINESQAYLSQQQDPASQSITDHLNLICTMGGQTWYVTTNTYGDVLSVFPLPTVPSCILVATTPVARTIAADLDAAWVRYQITADPSTSTASDGTTDTTSSTAAATYGTVEATLPQSIQAHGTMETYADLSSTTSIVGSSAAQAAGTGLLQQYVRANYAGPFTIAQGQLLTMGGAPMDIAMPPGPVVAQLALTDFGYGGEVVPGPVMFLIGEYEYDDTAETANVTPFQSIASDFSSLVSAVYPSG